MALNKKKSKDIIQLRRLTQVWPQIAASVAVIKSKADYEKALKLLDIIIDEVGPDTSHPLYSLMDHLGSLIEVYENKNLEESFSNPIDVLKHLMTEHKLLQSELPEIGSQGVVSEILRGKRKLNTRQVKALSKKFNVSVSTFL